MTEQRGVFLVISSIVISALVIFSTIIAWDLVRISFGTEELRSWLRVACYNSASSDFLHKNVLNRFSDEVTRLNKGLGLELIEAKVISPTMSSAFCHPNASGGCSVAATPFNPGVSDSSCKSGIPFSLLSGVNTCTTCKFVCDAGTGGGGDALPSNLLNNLFSATAAVVCEAKAKLPTSFLGARELVARIGLAAPPRGKVLPYRAEDPLNTLPGLSIAIGTELTTSALDETFLFSLYSNSTPPLPIDAATSQTAEFSPLKNFGNSAMELTAFSAAEPDQGYYLASTNPPNLLVPARPDGTATPMFPASGAVSYLPSETKADFARQEQLVACLNPVVLLRNVISSTIVELAARHGQLRKSTELLHVSPLGADGGASSPVLIVPFGQDLTAASYQLPYVNFAGIVSPDQYGDPFAPSSVSNPADQKPYRDQSAVTNQLRACYHLYSGGSRGIARWVADLGNQSFEPSIYTQPLTLRSSTPFNGAASERWEQECPWGAANCPDSLSSVGRNMSAAEVVYSMGATQRCPAPGMCGAAPTAKFSISSGRFVYGAEYDLTPDIRGLFAYLNKESIPTWKSRTATMRAVSSPGLFPLSASDNFPMGDSNYVEAAQKNSSVLLILHKPLSSSAALKQQIADFNNTAGGASGSRVITVLYFPTNYEDQTDTVLAQMKDLFNADTSIDGKLSAMNYIYVFTPFANRTEPAPSAAAARAAFRSYWSNILSKAGEGGAVSWGKNIFYERLLQLKEIL